MYTFSESLSSSLALNHILTCLGQKQYDTLRSQLQAAAEDHLRVSDSRIEDAVRTVGKGLPGYIYRVVSLVNIGTLPQADLATTGHA